MTTHISESPLEAVTRICSLSASGRGPTLPYDFTFVCFCDLLFSFVFLRGAACGQYMLWACILGGNRQHAKLILSDFWGCLHVGVSFARLSSVSSFIGCHFAWLDSLICQTFQSTNFAGAKLERRRMCSCTASLHSACNFEVCG